MYWFSFNLNRPRVAIFLMYRTDFTVLLKHTHTYSTQRSVTRISIRVLIERLKNTTFPL